MPNISETVEIARRVLPIIYVIDSSGSMSGEKIASVNEAMRDSIELLRDISAKNPDAEVKVGVLRFASGAEWIKPLTSLDDFFWNDLKAGGVTDLGSALNELNKKQKELQASIAQQRKKAAALNARIDQLIQQEIAAAERRRKAEAERRRKAEIARQARLKAQREQAAREKASRERAEARRKAEAERKEAAERRNASRNLASSKTKSSHTSKKNTRRVTPKPVPEVEERPIFNEADNADRALNSSFAANQGRLSMPITGGYAITRHYGSYNVAGLKGVQLDSKGINITGHPGAQARAVFKGEVTAIFSYSGMYNVIVRHGSYMSVYCNLSSVSVRNGQQVEARQTLGSVARDASGNCTLHFQLRKETAKLNPEAWFAR